MRISARVIVIAAVLVAVASPASAQTLTWSRVPSPSPAAQVNALYGVSCVSATTCTAVGLHSAGHEEDATLIEAGHGTGWSVVPSPSPSRGHYAELDGVSCVSAATCTAVGFYHAATGHYQTLVEAWNGTSWSVVPSPSPGPFPHFEDVSCVSATTCTAVGDYSPADGTSHTLVEAWNGTSWSVVPSPNRGTYDHLVGVSCVSATACTAVGSYRTASDIDHTLAEAWNGTSWSVTASRNPSPSGDYLYDVSCVSATTCTAVGAYPEHGAGFRTLAEAWNGTSWSVVTSPSPSPGDNTLSSVSCVSATACTAAGYRDSHNYVVNKTLVEAWNGTSWSVVTSPSPSPSDSGLDSVSCVSATACTAAGDRANAKGNYKTLIETGTASQ